MLENYYYLNQFGCVEDKIISDQEFFREVIMVMDVMQFSKEEVWEVFRLFVGILYFGNIEFIIVGGVQVFFKMVLGRFVELFGLDLIQFIDVLIQRLMFFRGEEIFMFFNV